MLGAHPDYHADLLMLIFVFFVPKPGYLSCCRFLDDNQIVTSSGDTTWWVKPLHCLLHWFNAKFILLSWHTAYTTCLFPCPVEGFWKNPLHRCIGYRPIGWIWDLTWLVFVFAVLFGTLKLASRQPHLLDTLVMSWAFHWLQIQGYLCLALAMPRLNSGTSERACADKRSPAMSLILMLSV